MLCLEAGTVPDLALKKHTIHLQHASRLVEINEEGRRQIEIRFGRFCYARSVI